MAWANCCWAGVKDGRLYNVALDVKSRTYWISDECVGPYSNRGNRRYENLRRVRIGELVGIGRYMLRQKGDFPTGGAGKSGGCARGG